MAKKSKKEGVEAREKRLAAEAAERAAKEAAEKAKAEEEARLAAERKAAKEAKWKKTKRPRFVREVVERPAEPKPKPKPLPERSTKFRGKIMTKNIVFIPKEDGPNLGNRPIP